MGNNVLGLSGTLNICRLPSLDGSHSRDLKVKSTYAQDDSTCTIGSPSNRIQPGLCFALLQKHYAYKAMSKFSQWRLVLDGSFNHSSHGAML